MQREPGELADEVALLAPSATPRRARASTTCTRPKEQPDLNWRNPDVRKAMFGTLSFWLERGVDGFRVDVAHRVMKDPELRDNPPADPNDRHDHKDMGEYGPAVAPLRPLPPGRARRLPRAAPAARGAQLVEAAGLDRRNHLRDLEEWVTWVADSRRAAHALQLQPAGHALEGGTPSAGPWTRWRRRCRPAPGRTGCWGTTTSTALPRGWERPPRGPRCCSCSACAVRRTLYYGDELGMETCGCPQ